MEIRYFTKQSLIEANKEAVRNNYEKSLSTKALEELNEESKFPIVFHIVGSDKRLVATELLLGPETTVWLDISKHRYIGLPYLEVDAPDLDGATRH